MAMTMSVVYKSDGGLDIRLLRGGLKRGRLLESRRVYVVDDHGSACAAMMRIARAVRQDEGETIRLVFRDQ